MYLCYIDESGDEAPLRTRTDPPVLVIGGIVVSDTRLDALVWDFLALKKRFNPSLDAGRASLTDLISFEVKGSNIRADLRADGRNRRRRALGLLDNLVLLLERHRVRIVAEIHVKGSEALGRWVYPTAVARLAERFDTRLRTVAERGVMILDSRTKAKNVPSVAAVTTRRFAGGGDLQRLVESPVFGHSDAHVLLQVADLVVSALLFPLACAGFCLCLLDNAHPSEQYLAIRERFGERVRQLEHRQPGPGGAPGGGIRVVDHMNRQPTTAMFTSRPFELR